MAIDQSRYVAVTSGVGGGAVVPTRLLIGRIFTQNNLVPPAVFPLEFTSADDVGDYFGTDSEEYSRAVFYFGFISKNITAPSRLGFSRWVATAVAPRIYGSAPNTLAQLKLVTAGSFGLTIGGVVNTFTALDFSGASTLADIAAILQTAIRTKTGTQWTAATVTYDAVRASFNFVGGSAVAAVITVQEGITGTPIAVKLNWLNGSTLIVANGAAVETVTATLNTSAELSDNFGSLVFAPALTTSDLTVEAAAWVHGQNVKYSYGFPVNASTYASYSAAVEDYSGVHPDYSLVAGEYPEMLCGMITAATNYNSLNATQNFMFQEAALTPSVTTNALANTLDALRVNYYGQTQSAGQLRSFYQRGVLMGDVSTAPVDMNTFANEQWLKAAITASLLTLLLALSEVPANSQGRGQILSTIQSVVDVALLNGVISIGKLLTNTQKLAIEQFTGDPNAWQLVQNIGYWLDGDVVQTTNANSGLIEYVFEYTLVYSKKDDVRRITGRDVLI